MSRVTTERRTAATPAARSQVDRATVIAVGCAVALICGCMLAGWWLTRHGVDLHLGSAFPLSGHYGLHVGRWLVVPAGIGVLAAAVAPHAATVLPWPLLLGGASLTSAGWAVALAVVAGPGAIATPLTRHGEYLAEVNRVNAMGVATYLDTFTRYVVGGPDAPQWTTHVAGHPPLPTLVFALLARAGLAGPGWAAAFCIAVGATAAAAVLSTLRLVAGEQSARLAAPFVVFAPAALWMATSADAVFAAVAAWGVCALAHAAGRRGWPSYTLALIGGLAFGACLMLSYGLILLAPIALAIVLVGAGRSRWAIGILSVAMAGALSVLAGFAVAGFWWPDGLRLTAERVMLGPGWQDRPTAYFLFANPAALAVAVGPAVVAALPRLWRPRPPRRFVVPSVAALVAIALAIGSNLSKGEVERIYLPFMLWLMPLAALLHNGRGHPGDGRRWLAAQVGWAVLVAVATSLAW